MESAELVVTLAADYGFFDARRWKEASTKCLEDLKSLHDGLLNKNVSSFKFLDSSTKVFSGILQGNLADLGDFDECLSLPNGKQCLAVMGLPKYLTRFRGANLIGSYCIPSSCSAKSLENAIASILDSANVTVFVNESYCTSNEPEKLLAREVLSISIYGLVLALCVISTLYDVFRRKIKKTKEGDILISFSLLENSRLLFSTEKGSGLMAYLLGLKVLSLIWILIGHRNLRAFETAGANKLRFYELIHAQSHQLAQGSHYGVDTFFVISAFLNTIGLLRVLDRSKQFPFVKYYFHRYIRTTPALFAMVVAYSGWYALIGDGPAWKDTTLKFVSSCTENGGWWATLLYVNNYVHDSDTEVCVSQSWYLSVDMQLYCLTPLVILPCWKWPKVKKFLLGSLLLISIVTAMINAYIYKRKYIFVVLLSRTETLELFSSDYMCTHLRTSSYITGIILGFFMDSIRKSGGKLHLKPQIVALGWLTTAVCPFVVFYNHNLNLPEEEHPYNPWESVIAIGLFRLFWSWGVSWIIVACQYGYGGIINSILSWQIFVPLGRLSYSMYLVNMAVISYQLGTSRTVNYLRNFDIVYQCMGDIVLTSLVAVVMSLMFEMPVMALEKYATAHYTVKSRKKSENVRGQNGTQNEQEV